MNPNLKNPHLHSEAFDFPGGKTGLVMFHGFTATPAEVRMAAERLNARGYTTLGPLLPGHGTQPEDLNRVTWQDWVAEGEKAYQAVKARCDRVFILGESMGGVLALYLASQHPEAAGVLAFSPAVALRIKPLDRAILPLISLFAVGSPKGSLDAEDNWQGYLVNPFKGVRQLLKFQQALLARMHLITVPLLVALGRNDTTIDFAGADVVMKGVSSKDKKLVWFEESSHVVLIDNQIEDVVATIAAFIESH